MFADSVIDEWFNVDDRGQVFSLDVLLALIIITVIMGVSANAMDLAGFKITDYFSGKSLDGITSDAAEVLINTPGSPGDWETSMNLNRVTPGLAEYGNESRNGTKVLSIKKINRLESKYPELMEYKLIPWGYHSSLIIYPINPTIKPITIHDEIPPVNTSEVAVANRTVMVDFLNLRALISINAYFNNSLNIYSESSLEICPHHGYAGAMEHQRPNFDLKSPGWTCAPIKISQQDLNFTDFYLISDQSASADGSARWILDRPENLSNDCQKFSRNSINVNDRISDILGQDNTAVIWLHIFTSGDASKAFNVYLIGVTKNTSPENVTTQYLNPQPCFLILKVWKQ